MPVIRLPDGSERKFDQPVTVIEVAASIGTGLARAALAGKVNGKLVDTSGRIEVDSDLAIVTEKDVEGLTIYYTSDGNGYLIASAQGDSFYSVYDRVSNNFVMEFEIIDNVWLGVSVENEKNTHRIETLAQIPAKVRFLSIEPLIEPLGNEYEDIIFSLQHKIHWIIIGGESGNDSGKYRYRPCELDWIEHIIDNTPMAFKHFA